MPRQIVGGYGFFLYPPGKKVSMDRYDPINVQDKMTSHATFPAHRGQKIGLILLGCLFLAACEPSRIKHSRDHFLQPTNPQVDIAASSAPGKDGTISATTTPDAPTPEEVYTITVTEMPVRDLLFALARDANKNIDVYPGIQGKVTLSAIDQPLTKILDRVAKQVGIRYEIQDKIIVVTPDSPFLKVYQVDYLGVEREMISTNKISSNLSTSKGPTMSNPLAGSDNNQSNSTLSTVASSKFWKSITQNVQAILGADTGIEFVQNSDFTMPPPAQGGGLGGMGGLEGMIPPLPALGSMGGAGNKGADNKPQTTKAGLVSVNVEAGVISIIATAQQHERIQEYLDSILENVHRQVLIESTVVEVELSDRFQEGVDWDLIFNRSAGVVLKSSFVDNINSMNAGSNAAQGILNYFTLGHTGGPNGDPKTDKGPVNATIKLLETFGNAKILSSPKIMALNNQPAILKVVKNRVFFTLKSSVTPPTSSTGTTTGTGTVASQPVFDTEIHTVPVGLVMTVTPQISKEGIVSLNVRPTISRISRWVDDPNPALVAGNTQTGLTASIQNSIPEIEVKEMETMMRVHSGQVAVMGGLMQDSMNNATAGVPLLSRLPGGLGSLFSHQDEGVTKSELVIFLRPVVMTHGRPRDMYADRTKESGPRVTTPPNAPVAAAAPAPAPASVATGVKSSAPAKENKEKESQGKEALPAKEREEKKTSAPAKIPTKAALPVQQSPTSANAMAVGSYLDFTSSEGLANIAQQKSQFVPISDPETPVNPPASEPSASQQPVIADRQPIVQPPQVPKQYYLDFGSYQDLAYVDDIQRQVNAIGLAIYKESMMVGGQQYMRLRSGPYAGQKEATEALAKLNDATALHASLATD